MAATGIKFDDGSGGFAANCFPVRGLNRFSDDDSGAWVVAQRAEQRRRFKAVLCNKPRDFESIRQERKRSEKEGTAIIPPALYTEDTEEEDIKVLDGFFLMKHCCVDDPVDLCSVNITGQGFSDYKEEDFQLFDNVAYINAGENFLPLDCFRAFPILRELEMPLNGLRGIQMKLGDFITLELLDLSYNNLSPQDVLPLGLLPNLRVLHLTGNSLKVLPPELAHPHVEQMKQGNRRVQRFPNLEILLLDDNKLSDLSTFAALAGLRKLKHLNLSKNEVYSVPQLMLVEGRHVTEEIEGFRSHAKTPKSGGGKSSRRSSRKSARRSARSAKSREISVVGSQPRVGDNTGANSTTQFLDEGGNNKEHAGIAENITTAEISNVENSNKTISDSVSQSQKESAEEDKTKVKPTQNETESKEEKETETQSDNVKEKESVDSLLDLDDMLEELNLDKIDEQVEQQIVAEKEEEEEERKKSETIDNMGSAFKDYPDEGDVPLPPPFPELQYLNVSHNLIEEEEGLLAIAAWPMLSEIVIHDNPLTTEHRGDPPLLKRFLHDRLGIHIERLKPKPLHKPGIEVQVKPSRTVKTKVPPVPRVDVDALLALEYSRDPSESSSSQASIRAPPEEASFDSSKPLPPISQDAGGMIIEEEEEEDGYDDTFDTEPDDCQEEDAAQNKSNGSGGSHDRRQQAADAFFMTALEDQTEDEPVATSSEKGGARPKQGKKPRHQETVTSRYQGYEEILEIDESQITDPVPTPKDIGGNIRALQYALNHPLVFRENRVHLDRPQRPFYPYVRGEVKQGKPRKPRTFVVEEALTFLKERKTVEEEGLANVLQQPKKYRKHFSDAPDLLQQVQHKYNKVRARSVKDARSVQNVIKDTMRDVEEKARQTQQV